MTSLPALGRILVHPGRVLISSAFIAVLALLTFAALAPYRITGLTSIFSHILLPDCRPTRFGPTETAYGSGLEADALGNTRIGGPFLTTTAYRFRADHTGQLEAIRFYVIWSAQRKGYHGGTGGALLVSLQTDDGTANHAPSGTTLASILHDDPLHKSHFPFLSFSSPVSLEAGVLYHLVFTNPDPDPSANYVSVDCLLNDSLTSPSQPTVANLDWGQMLGSMENPGRWSPRKGYTPILELCYADGYSSGIGYMEVWIKNPKQISGSSAVRELFTASGPDRNISALSVRVRRLSGSDPLEISLEEGDGAMIERRAVTAGEVPATYGWVRCVFDSVRTLKSRKDYQLVLRSASGSCYETFPIAKGTPQSIGFTCNTVFPDGYAQFTTGSSWTGWDQWGQLDRRDGDLQFFFTVLK